MSSRQEVTRGGRQLFLDQHAYPSIKENGNAISIYGNRCFFFQQISGTVSQWSPALKDICQDVIGPWFCIQEHKISLQLL